MQTTVQWTHQHGAKTMVCIHHTGNVAGRYAVSRIWPDAWREGDWCAVALWPVGDDYAGDLPTLRLDAAGNAVVEGMHAAAVRVIDVARARGYAVVSECVEVAA